MKKFKNEQEAISCIEKAVENYKKSTYLEKADRLTEMEELEKGLPEEFHEARRILSRYTEMSPVTALQRAQKLVHRIDTAPDNVYVLSMREQARAMLEGIPRTKEYESVRDLLRHYATQGD